MFIYNKNFFPNINMWLMDGYYFGNPDISSGYVKKKRIVTG